MIELQKFIIGQLQLIHSRVYQEWGPQNPIFPYVVYCLPTSEEVIDHREDFILEIDVWDRPDNGSTKMMQLIADKIDYALNRTRYFSSEGWFTRLYRVNRLMIPDPDPLIRRRQLRYECKTYVGGN